MHCVHWLLVTLCTVQHSAFQVLCLAKLGKWEVRITEDIPGRSYSRSSGEGRESREGRASREEGREGRESREEGRESREGREGRQSRGEEGREEGISSMNRSRTSYLGEQGGF